MEQNKKSWRQGENFIVGKNNFKIVTYKEMKNRTDYIHANTIQCYDKITTFYSIYTINSRFQLKYWLTAGNKFQKI